MFHYQNLLESWLGYPLRPNAKGEAIIHCPNPHHKDARESCSVNCVSALFQCHGCGLKGNLSKLAELLGQAMPNNTNTFSSSTKPSVPLKHLNDQIAHFHQQLLEPVREYWHARGINDEVLDAMQIGYNPADQHFTFPYHDEQGSCFLYKAIDIKKHHYWYPAGVEGIDRIYNLKDIAEARATRQTLYIAEGEKDCLVLKMLGYLCVGISGANGFRSDYVSRFAGVERLVVCFDNDQAGKEGGDAAVKLFQE